MKKIYTLLVMLMTVGTVLAQSPAKMSYQAVVRDETNALLAHQIVGMQLSILQDSPTGTSVYVETHAPLTNSNGLVSIELGNGVIVSGDFTSIDWSDGPYFLKTETDPTGGTTYTITGTSQFLSVPYALHAGTADTVKNEADGDPANELQALSIKNDTIVLSNGGFVKLPADSGEINTASNTGVNGVGVFKQKTGVDLEFKQINAGSSKVSITDDTGNNEVDVDIVEGNIQIGNLNGAPAGTVVGTTDPQTLTNKTLNADNNTITNIVNANIKAGAAIDASKIADGSVSNSEFQYLNGATSSLVGITDVQTLSNKTLTDATTYLQDDADNTKKLQLQLTGITTGTTRILTVPDASTTLVGTDVAQTLSNKTLNAPIISSIINVGTLTLPATTTTLVGRSTVDVLTNKTFGDNLNMNANKMINLLDPTDPQDAATKIYVDGLSGVTSVYGRTGVVVASAGDYTASQITNFDVQVRTSRLDQMAAPTSDIDMNAYKITGLLDPTLAQDAATKIYVDGLSGVTSVYGRTGAVFASSGDYTASQITNFDTQVRTSRLDQMAAPTSDININANKITNLLDPISPTDAATKSYVDGKTLSLDVKESVFTTTTVDLSSNVSLSSPPAYNNSGGASGRGQITAILVTPDMFTVDGINIGSVGNGSRILLKDQVDAAQNGIWTTTVAGTSLTLDRASDFDHDPEVTAGANTFITSGNTYANMGFVLITQDPITIGGNSGTSLSFYQYTGAGQIIAGTGLSKLGNTIDVIGSSTILANANSLEVNSSNTANQVLLSSGTLGTASTFGALPLGNANAVSGTLPLSNGGTGSTSFASANRIVATNSSNTAFETTSIDPSRVVTDIGTQTLSNKTLTDAATYLQDNLDNSKKLQLQLSGITTSTTRVLTVPDANTTLVGTDVPQILINKTLDSDNNTITNIDNENIKAGAAIDASKIANGSVSNSAFQYLNGVTSSIVGIADVQTLSNKTLTDATTYLQDNLDNSKKLQLQLSGITTSTTRILTVPDANTTLVGTDVTQTLTNKTLDSDLNTITNIDNTDIKLFAAIDASKIADGTVSNSEFQYLNGVTSSLVGITDVQTLSNKTLTDVSTYLQDNLDNTKKLQLQLSGITASTTRTLTVPDANTTLVGTDVPQILINKTLDSDNNTITNIDNADIKAGAAIDASKIADGTVSNSAFQYLNGVTSSIVGIAETQTLSNKTLTDATTYLQDDADNSKKLQLQLSGITTGNTTILTVPDASTTLVGTDVTQTLSNKTLNADANTITNIDDADIKAGAAIDATKIANGSVSNSEFQYLNGVTSSIVGISDAQTLSNKTLTDVSTYLQDNLDNTKKLQLQLSGITTSTTRILTVPDANTTLVGTDVIQTLTNKILDADANTITNIDNTDIKAGAAIDASKIADGSVSNSEFQYLNGVTSSIVGIAETQTLTNKTLMDATTYLQDNVDNTKKLQLQLSEITTGNTRILTVPDASTTLVGTDVPQILSNKTLNSDNNTITNIDNTGIKASAAIDATKIADGTVSNSEFQQLAFIGSSAVGISDNQTLSNKTLSNPRFQGALHDANGNEIIGLLSTGSAVNEITIGNATFGNAPRISATGNGTNIDLDLSAKGTGVMNLLGTSSSQAEFRLFENANNGTNYIGLQAPPAVTANMTYTLPNTPGTNGQVLSTDGAGNLGWTSNISRVAYHISNTLEAVNTTFETVGYFSWDHSRYSDYSNGVIVYETEIVDRDLELRVYDATNNQTLGFEIVTVSGFQTLAFINPGTDARLELRVRKSSSAGVNPKLYGIQMEWDY